MRRAALSAWRPLCATNLAAAEKGLVLGKRKRPKATATLATRSRPHRRHIKPLLGTMAR